MCGLYPQIWNVEGQLSFSLSGVLPPPDRDFSATALKPALVWSVSSRASAAWRDRLLTPSPFALTIAASSRDGSAFWNGSSTDGIAAFFTFPKWATRVLMNAPVQGTLPWFYNQVLPRGEKPFLAVLKLD